MADILTLNDFRRDDAKRAKISAPKFEHHSHTYGRSPFVTFPDPLPRDWGEFWKASDFWWRPGPANIPTSERSELHSLTLWRSPFVSPDPLPRDWGEFWKVDDFRWRRHAIATCPSPESWHWS